MTRRNPDPEKKVIALTRSLPSRRSSIVTVLPILHQQGNLHWRRLNGTRTCSLTLTVNAIFYLPFSNVAKHFGIGVIHRARWAATVVRVRVVSLVSPSHLSVSAGKSCRNRDSEGVKYPSGLCWRPDYSGLCWSLLASRSEVLAAHGLLWKAIDAA